MKKAIFAAALCAATVAAAPANAAVTFTLNNVKFTDGTAITGSFTTNNALTNVTSFAIFTRAGGSFADDEFSSAGGDSASLTSGSITFTQPGFIFSTTLQLMFQSALSSAGATISGGSENLFFFSRDVASGGTVTSGTTSPAVPEPASWGMMILGMGAVGYAMRRRKITTRVSYAA